MGDEPSSQLDQREMSRKALARARSELLGLRTHLTTIDDAYRSAPPSDMASAVVAAMHNRSGLEGSTSKSDAESAASNAVTTQATGVHGLGHEAHRAEIAAVKRRAAAASTPGLATESASMIAHANIEIESANTEIARLAAELNSMRVSHEAEVAALRERVASTESQNAALESECARLRRVLAETAAMADSHSTAVREAKALHGKTQAAAALVEEEASRLERETADAMDELQKQHAEAVAEHGALKSEMAVEHAESIGVLKVEHAESMMRVETQHEEAVRALRANHLEEMKRTREAHEQQISVQQQAHESAIGTLTNIVRDRDNALVALQAEHKTIPSDQNVLESQLTPPKTENEESALQQLGSPTRVVPDAVAASPASRYTKATVPHFPVDIQTGASQSSPAAAAGAVAAGLSASALQQWHDAQQRELARLFEESQKMQQALTAQTEREVASAHFVSDANDTTNTVEQQPPTEEAVTTDQDDRMLIPKPRHAQETRLAQYPASPLRGNVPETVADTTDDAILQPSETASTGLAPTPVQPAKGTVAVNDNVLPTSDVSTPGRRPAVEIESTETKVATPGSAKKSVDWESAAALAVARSQERLSSQPSSPARTPKRSTARLPPSSVDFNSKSASKSAKQKSQGDVSELHKNAAIGHSSSTLMWPKTPASPGSPNRSAGGHGIANDNVPSLALPPAPPPELITAAVAFKQKAAELLMTPPRPSGSGDGAAGSDLEDLELACLVSGDINEPDGDKKDRGLLARSPRGKTAIILASTLESTANGEGGAKSSGNARVAARDKALWAAAAEHATAVAGGRLARPVGPKPHPEPEPEPQPKS